MIDAVRESGHSCFPVVADDLDDLVGVLFVNDLFRATPRRSAGDLTERSPLDISRRIRQPHVVPETRRVLDVLAEMRQQHRAFAVVVDEYGGVAGVLTVKDLLEPLVGELARRVRRRRGPRGGPGRREPLAHRRPDERGRGAGSGSGSAIPEGEYVTIGGFLFDGFGHIPIEGERLTVDGWELRVVELDKRRIAKVLAKHGPGDSDEDVQPPLSSALAEAGRLIGDAAARGPAEQVRATERRDPLD